MASIYGDGSKIFNTEPPTLRLIHLNEEEFRVLVTLVDNAWRMADEYREGRTPNTEAETKALVYQLTIERIQTALKGA